PNNCIVVMSGAIKTSDIKKLAEEYLEKIPSQPEPAKVHITEPPQLGERRIEVKREVSSPYLAIGYHIPETKHEDYYPLVLLSDIMSSGKSSRLYRELVDKRQVATMIATSIDVNFDPSLFAIYGVAAGAGSESAMEQAVYEVIDSIAKNGITAEELQKVKNAKLMEFYSQIETINGKSNNIGTYEVFFGDYKKMFEAPAEFNKVTAADIQRVAGKYFKKSKRTVALLKSDVGE
ncbi:MAG: insulinase family protein, partial [Chitinophagaceae bacterium]